MPSSPGGIRVNPNGRTAVVTFTLPNGGTPVAYSSRSGAGTISLPATVSVETTFWFQEQTTLTVSALVGTQQSATSAGTTASVDLSGGGVAGLTVAVVAQSGGSSVASLTVKDEGSALATAADTLDFVGAGVTATGTGGTKTITIPGGGSSGLTPTAVKISAYTAAASDLVPVDTTSGNVTITLPTAPTDKTQIGIKHVTRGGSNVVTFACGGSDVLNKAGGATSGTLTLLNQSVVLQYKASTGIWYVTGGDLPLSQLDSRFQAALPSQTGQVGKFLSTDGTTPTWTAPPGFPVPPYTPLSGGVDPASLVMKAVNSQRSSNPLPTSGPQTSMVEEFETYSTWANRYVTINNSGTGPTEGVSNNKFTLTGTSGLIHRSYRSHTKLVAPTGVFTAVRVEAATNAGSLTTQSRIEVGFYQDPSNNNSFIGAYWRPSDGGIGVVLDTATFSGGGGGSSYVATVPFPTGTNTGWIGFMVDWPYIMAFYSADGVAWTLCYSQPMSTTGTTVNLYDPTLWANYRPYFAIRTESATSQTVSKFVAGYVGAFGYRDMKLVRYADGTPLRRNGLYYVTCTLAHGTGSFRTDHMAIMSFDPNTYRMEIVRHLFYKLAGTGTGACYGGQCVYDEATGVWNFLVDSWGFDDQATGVDLVYATTQVDILAPGVSVLPAQRLTGLSTTSLYDPTIRRDSGGVWRVAAIETSARTGWAAPGHMAIFSGTSLTALTKTSSDTTHTGYDGANWSKINGNWYILAGGGSSFAAWSPDLSTFTLMPNWTSDARVAALIPFGSFPAHPCVIEVDDGASTRYVVVTFDASTTPVSVGNVASVGAMVVLEATATPSGQEFNPKANTYFGY